MQGSQDEGAGSRQRDIISCLFDTVGKLWEINENKNCRQHLAND